jgi:hypothetical protein
MRELFCVVRDIISTAARTTDVQLQEVYPLIVSVFAKSVRLEAHHPCAR